VGESIEVIPIRSEARIILKIKRLLRQAKCPRWLHHFGPKKYEFWQHALALLIKQECRLSYRRIASLLNALGHTVPTYSALAKMSRRIPLAIWQALLHVTSPKRFRIGAMDGSFFARSNPSFHYLERTGRKWQVRKPLQVGLLIDACSKKCASIRIRVRARRDFADAEYLLRHAPSLPKTFLADSAYDVESVYRYAKDNGIVAMVDPRKNCRRGFCRNYMRKRFRESTYHKRSLVESVIGSIKRRSGSYCLSTSARTLRAEIYARVIAYNMKLTLLVEIFNRAL